MAEIEYIKSQGHRTPIAYANLDETECHWLIAVCPYCGEAHSHGAGTPPQAPREFLGHRQAQCAEGAPNNISSEAPRKNGYIIVEDGYH